MQEGPLFPSQPLEQVREGMTVVDRSGTQLGKVIRVRMGDFEAVTIAGNEPEGAGVLIPAPPVMEETATMIGTGPVWRDADALDDLPEPVRQHLLRAGFVEIQGRDLHGAQRFIAGSWVSTVSGNTVVVHRPPAPSPSVSVEGDSQERP